MMTDKQVKKPQKKPTIAELERILDSDEEITIEILPNGSIREHKKRRGKKSKIKPLTYREDLGGEYAHAIATNPDVITGGK